MSEELGPGEIKRRIEAVEEKKANSEALELITDGFNARIKRLENAQVWMMRTLIVMMVGIIASLLKDFI